MSNCLKKHCTLLELDTELICSCFGHFFALYHRYTGRDPETPENHDALEISSGYSPYEIPR